MTNDFRLYMLVGGIPQAVNEYITTNNFRKVDLVLNVGTPVLFVETCKKLSQMFEMILGTNHALIESVKVNCDESIQIHLDHQLEILERRLNNE